MKKGVKMFNFDSDDETNVLFELVVEFLVKYFGHQQEAAITLINNFYKFQKQREIHDDWYHHDGPYRVACNIQFFFFLKESEDFNDWAERNHYYNQPIEAQKRYNEIFGKL